MGGGHTHSPCPPVSAAHNPETPKRRHAGLSGIIPACSDSTLSSGDWLWVWGASCPELDACTWPGSRVVVALSPAGFPLPRAGLHYQQRGREARATRVVIFIPRCGLSHVVSTAGPGAGLLVRGLALECL